MWDNIQYNIKKYEGVRVIIGGLLLQIVLGTLYVWGSISVYVTSYLRQFDANLTINDMNCVFPFMTLFMTLTIPFGVYMARRVGVRTLAVTVITCNSMFICLSSKATGRYSFYLIYSILPGMMKGLCYLLPVYCCWQYFPNKKGLVSGICFCGYGLGTFFFNFLTTAVANPHNYKPSIVIQEGVTYVHYFDKRVYQNTPKMLTTLGIALFIVGIIGALMLSVPDKQNNDQLQQQLQRKENSQERLLVVDREKVYPDVVTALKSRIFWHLYTLGLLSSGVGFFVANAYKNYAFDKIHDDYILTKIGAISSIFNGICRIFWGILQDKYSFKTIYRVLIIGLFVLIITLDQIVVYPLVYLIWISLIMFHEGGHFCIFPTVFNNIFGEKDGYFITGLMTISFAMANFGGYFFGKYLVPVIGYSAIFYIYGFLEFICFLLLRKLNENHKWNLNNVNNVEMKDI